MARLARYALLVFLLASPAAADPLAAPVNLSFEADSPGALPSGWEISPSGGGAIAQTVAEGCPEGIRCARFARQDSGQGYGALLEVVRADAYRGKRIRLRGMLRFTGGAGQAFLYLQSNRRAAEPESVTGQAAGAVWRAEELLADIPTDAETFQFGLVAVGPVEAWLDAVKVEVLGPAGLGNEPARALTDRGVENLAALARLVGLVRYFHPSDESAALDWPAWTIEAAAPRRVIEDRLTVTWVDPALDSVRPGDVVEEVEGRPAREAIGELEPLVSAATPAYRRYRTLELLGAGRQGEARTLRLRRGAESFAVTLHATAPLLGPGRLRGARPEKLAELRPGLFYLDLDRVDDGDLAEAMPRLVGARGLIFDLRGYPERISEALLAHLLAAPAQTPGSWNAIRVRPDRPPGMDHLSWILQPLAPRLAARAVFLTDERAFSRAETYLDIVSYYRLGEIVGGATGGTNGEVNDMDLPGGYHVTWTGSRSERLGGARLQGVGIAPTIPVAPTAAGVAEGQDEVLARAIALFQ